jgi:hypothetical protein
MCEACNYVKESHGWRVVTRTDENGTHTAIFRTPTGEKYQSKAPRLPGWTTSSEVETAIACALHAA